MDEKDRRVGKQPGRMYCQPWIMNLRGLATPTQTLLHDSPLPVERPASIHLMRAKATIYGFVLKNSGSTREPHNSRSLVYVGKNRIKSMNVEILEILYYKFIFSM